MKFVKIFFIFINFCFYFNYVSADNKAITPIDAIKKPIEQGISVLRDAEYSKPEKKDAQREKIWEIVRDIFDFREISMRTLATDKDKFNETQKLEFIKEFTVLLKNAYVDKLQGEYHNEQVVFVEQVIEDNKALVKTKVIREKVEIPIDYNMLLQGNTWKIYDIKVEGVSLIKNYRTQFKEFLVNKSPDKLIQTLKDKNINRPKKLRNF